MTVLRRVNASLFVLFLVAGGALFFVVERGAHVEGEKRKLAQMPAFSWAALTSHNYFRAIDDFVADNFQFRYALTEFSGEIRAARGWPGDDVQVFTTGARKVRPTATASAPDAAPPVAMAPAHDRPEVAPPVAVAPEPDKPEVAPPVAVAPEPDKPEVAPPVAVAPEPDKSEVAPPVTVAPEPDKPEMAPPLAVTPVSDKPEVAPPVAVVPVSDKPEVAPPVAVTTEPDKPEVAPPVAVTPVSDKPEVAPPVAVVPEPDKPEVEPPVVAALEPVRFVIEPPASVPAEPDTPMAGPATIVEAPPANVEPEPVVLVAAQPSAPPQAVSTPSEAAASAPSMKEARTEAPPASAAPSPPQVSATAPSVRLAAHNPPPPNAALPPPPPVAAPTPAPAPTPPVKVAASEPAKPAAPDVKINAPNDPYEVVEAVIVYRGRALQIMGGTPGMAAPLIQAVNRYQQELGPDVTVYFMAMPIGSDFYLPERVNRGVLREKILIDGIHARLNPAVRAVRAYDRLAEHTAEYLYFNTDHHWTGLGAYYAYTAFAQAARFSPLPLSALSKGEIPNFLGTLYYRTMSPALKAKGDTVAYYRVPNRTEVMIYGSGSRVGQAGRLYVEFAAGANAYGVFLGGDFPLMRISSDVRNGRRIVVIKDSYGNAFVPYLAAHYQDVFVIDYRSYKGNIKNLIREHGIQDVLFAHNTFVVASGYTAQQAAFFLDSPYQ